MPSTNPRQHAMSLQDLSDQLAMIDALLANTCGEARQSFGLLDAEQRDWYLTHCSQMVFDCRNAAAALIDRDAARG